MGRRATVYAITLAVGLAGGHAAADDAKPVKTAPKASGEPVFDSENKTALSKYNDTILKGNAKYLAKDYPGALDIYRSAIPLSPKSALAHYVIAEALIASGNLPDAEASLAKAESTSDDRNPGLRAKVLFLQADVKERLKKWDEAKAAWQLYTDYATKHAGAGFVPSAASRIQAIDDMVKQEKAYVAVRERIAAEKAAPPSSPPKK